MFADLSSDHRILKDIIEKKPKKPEKSDQSCVIQVILSLIHVIASWDTNIAKNISFILYIGVRN